MKLGIWANTACHPTVRGPWRAGPGWWWLTWSLQNFIIFLFLTHFFGFFSQSTRVDTNCFYKSFNQIFRSPLRKMATLWEDYRVGRKFPPDKKLSIPETVCKLAQNLFGWNIPMGVGYNGIKEIFNKTSASLCHRLKSGWRKSSWDTHLFLREI